MDEEQEGEDGVEDEGEDEGEAEDKDEDAYGVGIIQTRARNLQT